MLHTAAWIAGAALFFYCQLSESAPALLFAGILLTACTGMLLAYYGFKFVLFAFIACLPFSVKFETGIGNIEALLPSELFIAVLVFTTVFSYLFFSKHDKKFLFHPVTLLIGLYILTSLLTLPFSSMPVVSIKALAVRTGYITVFYFLLHLFLKEYISNNIKIYLLYAVSLALVVLFVFWKHSDYNFSKDTSGLATRPFYSDHTIYSACISMVIPACAMFAVHSKLFNIRWNKRILLLVLTLLLTAAVFLSFCRAAWVSLLFIAMFSFLLTLKIRFNLMLFLFVACCTAVVMNRDTIIESFRQNKHNSNARNAGIEEQTKSITNISNDESNAERVNRWVCAARMFSERPLTGFGLGTYQFRYLDFQREKEMTRISVTTPYNIIPGKGGTAHSEYLLALSEGGLFSFLFFVLTIFFSVKAAMRTIYHDDDVRKRILAKAALLSMLTYAVHGAFNNFLDTDKAAFLFWGSVCVIVTLKTREGTQMDAECNDPV